MGSAARHRRGFSLIEVMIGLAILTFVVLAVIGAMQISIHNTRNAEPETLARTAVSNVQTDLGAISMYDAQQISGLGTGATITVTPPPTPSPMPSVTPAYYAGDTKPISLRVKSISSPPAGGGRENVTLSYTVQSTDPNHPALQGDTVIPIVQKAPPACDPRIQQQSKPCPTPTP